MDEPFDEPAVDENPFGGNEPAETKEVEIPVPKPRQTTEPAIASSHATSSPSFSEVKISTTEAFPSLFEITVSDPEKKGEGINAYVIYTINTKTTSPDFLQPSMSVPRRFNNFAWLYTQLTSKHPGVIVPPIPDKQALGRFDATFLDQRRAALEKCLRRIAAHPTLCKSPEFKLFVEAQDLEGEIKKREPKKSLFSALTSSVTDAVQTATQSFSKIPESDEWFENKRAQIETLESQLKLLLKSLEAFVKHRRDLAAASGDFGEHSTSLGNSEFNKPLASCLSHLGDIQKKIQEILNVQADADEHNVEYVVEEYLRIISSVKVAMETRVKHYSAWKSADAALIKKKENLAKLQQQPNKSSKLPALEAEAEEAEKSVEAAKKQFEDISELLKKELSRFDKEKIEDFQTGLLKFVETMIESQKKVIHLWEEYLPEVQGL